MFYSLIYSWMGLRDVIISDQTDYVVKNITWTKCMNRHETEYLKKNVKIKLWDSLRVSRKV